MNISKFVLVRQVVYNRCHFSLNMDMDELGNVLNSMAVWSGVKKGLDKGDCTIFFIG